MTPAELDEIEARVIRSDDGPGDVPALIAEVRRLTGISRKAYRLCDVLHGDVRWHDRSPTLRMVRQLLAETKPDILNTSPKEAAP